MMTGHRVLAILVATPSAASECSPRPPLGSTTPGMAGCSRTPKGSRPPRSLMILVFGPAVKSGYAVAARFASLTLDRRPEDQLLGWSSRRPR